MALARGLRQIRKSILEMRARRNASAVGAQLPPGKLRIPADGEARPQTYLLEQAEEWGPIFKVWLPHKMTTCIVGHDIAKRFLSENEGKIRAGTPDLTPLFPHGFLRALEGDVHRKYRRQILDAFNETPLESHEDALRAIFRDALAELTAAEQPVPCATIRKIMKNTTTAVFTKLILGVDRDSERYRELVAAYDRYAPNGIFIVVREEHKPAYEAIRSLVLKIAEDIKGNTNAPPSLLRHLVRSDTVDDTTLGNLIQMVEASRYDVHGLLTWILKHLGDNPDAQELARSGGQGENGGCSAIKAVPRETLRMEQSELLLRVALENIVFDGYFIPKGSHIRICVWEAHHDPMKFSDPFKYDPSRFMSSKVSPNLHSPFGLDKHRCLGADWTYRLCELMVEELTEGYAWETRDDGEPVMGRFHFEPSKTFSIEIHPRTSVPEALARQG